MVYPGLAPGSGTEGFADLRLFENQEDALRSHKKGVAILLSLHLSKSLKFMKKALVLPASCRAAAADIGGHRRFENRICETVRHTLFHRNIRSAEAFHAHAAAVEPELISRGRVLMDGCIPVLTARRQARAVMSRLTTAAGRNRYAVDLLETLDAELARLVPDRFPELYGPDRLPHLPRYIKALEIRAQRAVVDTEKDRAKSAELAVFTDSLKTMLDELSPLVSEEKRTSVESYFWMIEELKVSLFAQELKTPVPVSGKRLKKMMQEIQRMV
jgi:ATP-dependent helicase HrpA